MYASLSILEVFKVFKRRLDVLISLFPFKLHKDSQRLHCLFLYIYI